MKFIRALFFPFSLLYGWLMHMRNRQFDNGQRAQTDFDRAIISVGNLSTGGTGKTPMIELLIRKMKDNHKLATVSRGYGRQTRGFRIANDEDTAKTIGDEPLQFYRKFKNDIKVSVCEQRILAIPYLLKEDEAIQVFLLDDAFQHRKIARDFNILLSDYNHPFYKDYVLPTGNLREPRQGADRADAVIITKCPLHLSKEEKEIVVNAVKRYNDHAPVYFSHIIYQDLKPVFGEGKVPKRIALLTGIAKTKSIVDHLSLDHAIVKHFEYADHYQFREKDLDEIQKQLSEYEVKTLVTTEKDMVRLLPLRNHSIFNQFELFYLPIAFELDGEEELMSQIIKVTEKVKR